MPACPRSEIIDENEVGTYHCYNRCVRRAFLCGRDAYSRKNYEHRKEWIRDLLVELAGIFAIDIFKYALQDNHFHLILRNRPDLARRWSDRKVLRRAMQLFPDKFRRLGLYVERDQPLPRQLLRDEKLITEMRKRLSSISWLMKILQERIAKRANREDEMTGTFWDGRFRCEALLDSAAVFACAMYVDLNLVHCGKHKTPEESKYTSAYDRIRGLRARLKKRIQEGVACDGYLCPLNTLGDYPGEDLAKADRRASNQGLLELPLVEYLKLLDQLGRILREGKRGAIPSELVPILERLGIDPEHLLECVESFRLRGRRAVGSVERLRDRAARVGRRWLHGISKAKQFFKSTLSNAS